MYEHFIAEYDAAKERARVLADLEAARKESIRTLHAFRPNISASQIAEWFGLSTAFVERALRSDG